MQPSSWGFLDFLDCEQALTQSSEQRGLLYPPYTSSLEDCISQKCSPLNLPLPRLQRTESAAELQDHLWPHSSPHTDTHPPTWYAQHCNSCNYTICCTAQWALHSAPQIDSINKQTIKCNTCQSPPTSHKYKKWTKSRCMRSLSAVQISGRHWPICKLLPSLITQYQNSPSSPRAIISIIPEQSLQFCPHLFIFFKIIHTPQSSIGQVWSLNPPLVKCDHFFKSSSLTRSDSGSQGSHERSFHSIRSDLCCFLTTKL